MNHRVTAWRGALGLLALATLTACSVRVADTGSRGTLTIAANEVRISVPGAPQAYVQSGGGLVIGQRTVTLTPAQQKLAQRYYRYALGITAAGQATGEAGGHLGIAIVGSLFSALWHDNSAIINRTAHAGAAKVRANVQTLCAQMAGLETVQNMLAASQPSFTPYRIIRQKDVTQCFKGSERHSGSRS